MDVIEAKERKMKRILSVMSIILLVAMGSLFIGAAAGSRDNIYDVTYEDGLVKNGKVIILPRLNLGLYREFDLEKARVLLRKEFEAAIEFKQPTMDAMAFAFDKDGKRISQLKPLIYYADKKKIEVFETKPSSRPAPKISRE
jgi:hypothetical protein